MHSGGDLLGFADLDPILEPHSPYTFAYTLSTHG